MTPDLFAGPGRVPELLPDRPVAVLCCSSRSVYKGMRGVEAFDEARDAWTFAGGMPVVAHPPCRGYSAYTRHQAKATDLELRLGVHCADLLRSEGGVLEHPAHSRLFEVAGLPRPGQRRGDLFTVAVLQAWFDYPMRKATWLVFSRIDPTLLEFPFAQHDSSAGVGDRRRQQVMSRRQRAATSEPMARFLVGAARLVGVQR